VEKEGLVAQGQLKVEQKMAIFFLPTPFQDGSKAWI
jgi:hypothetical protein